MQWILTFCFLASLSSLWAGNPGDWETAYKHIGITAGNPVNTLSPEEDSLGWELLFDGRSIDHWRGFRQSKLPMGWIIEDSSLYRFTGGGDIMYDLKPYDNFVWSVEWKTSFGGNSGLIFRSVEDYWSSWDSGPEMQLLDNDNHRDAISMWTLGGGMYDMYEPVYNDTLGYDATYAENGVPFGFNKSIIVVYGPYVRFWLNGKNTMNAEIGTPEWESRRLNSKWRDKPYFGTFFSGYLSIQDHGDKFWFRNIKIRPISEDPHECEIWPGRDSCATAAEGQFKSNFCLLRPADPQCIDVPGCMDTLYGNYDSAATVHVQDSCGPVEIGHAGGFFPGTTVKAGRVYSRRTMTTIIRDLQGREMGSFISDPDAPVRIDLDLEPGIYFLENASASGTIMTKTLLFRP